MYALIGRTSVRYACAPPEFKVQSHFEVMSSSIVERSDNYWCEIYDSCTRAFAELKQSQIFFSLIYSFLFFYFEEWQNFRKEGKYTNIYLYWCCQTVGEARENSDLITRNSPSLAVSRESLVSHAHRSTRLRSQVYLRRRVKDSKGKASQYECTHTDDKALV